jgi:zinc/manganese transport system substrate-binding protein
MIQKILAPCVIALVAAVLGATPALADPLAVVAAENFYGDIAAQIGGAHVVVTSILANPDQDPHMFEASPATARALAKAKITIVNSLDYDPWMDKLLSASKGDGRVEINVAQLAGKKTGDNPHLWYNPAYVKALGEKLAAELGAADPPNKDDYARRADDFAASLAPLEARIADMHKKYSGWPITASEPVFGYMADLIGFSVRNQKFALAVMNNTEPSAADVGAFENDLKDFKVKAMIFNAQASEPTVQRLAALARDQRIPVVGITETEPAGQTYQTWMLGQLDALDKALSRPR